MDLGATLCKPKDPQCTMCPLKTVCKAYQIERVSDFPKLKLKTEKPIRYGTAFVLIHEDKILFERRPEKGLLGGMAGLPTTPWEQNPLSEIAAFEPENGVEWETLPKAIKHTFTHFHLYLSIKISISKRPPKGLWIASDAMETIALPTVMKKVIKEIPGFFKT